MMDALRWPDCLLCTSAKQKWHNSIPKRMNDKEAIQTASQSYLPFPMPPNSEWRQKARRKRNQLDSLIWHKEVKCKRVNPESCTCTTWQGTETHYLKCKCQPCRWQRQHSKLLFYSSKHLKYVKIFPQQEILAYWSLISLLLQSRGFWSMFLALTGRNHSCNKDARCSCSRCLHCIICIQMNSTPAELPCILSESGCQFHLPLVFPCRLFRAFPMSHFTGAQCGYREFGAFSVLQGRKEGALQSLCLKKLKQCSLSELLSQLSHFPLSHSEEHASS